MSFPEHRFRPRELHTPIDKTDSFSPVTTQPEELDGQLKNLIVESLKSIYTEPGAAAEFEGKLANAGLVEMLEEVGILPSNELPSNPHDPYEEPVLFNQWREQHSKEYEDYERRLEKRNEVLRHLYTGVMLNREFDQELFPRLGVATFGLVTIGPPTKLPSTKR